MISESKHFSYSYFQWFVVFYEFPHHIENLIWAQYIVFMEQWNFSSSQLLREEFRYKFWLHSLICSPVLIIHMFNNLLRPYMETFHITYRYISFLLNLQIYIALGSIDTYSGRLLQQRICCSNIHIVSYNYAPNAHEHEAATGTSMFKPILIIRVSYGHTCFGSTVQFFQKLLWLTCCEQRFCVKVLIYCATLYSLKTWWRLNITCKYKFKALGGV